MTTFRKSLFLTQYRMRYAIYIPPNTKERAINLTMAAYGNLQNAIKFARTKISDLLQALKHLMETRVEVVSQCNKIHCISGTPSTHHIVILTDDSSDSDQDTEQSPVRTAQRFIPPWRTSASSRWELCYFSWAENITLNCEVVFFSVANILVITHLLQASCYPALTIAACRCIVLPRNYGLYRNGNFCNGTQVSKIIAGGNVDARAISSRKSTGL